MPESTRFFDIRPNATGSASGTAKSKVRKKISSDVAEPKSIARSIFTYFSGIIESPVAAALRQEHRRTAAVKEYTCPKTTVAGQAALNYGIKIVTAQQL